MASDHAFAGRRRVLIVTADPLLQRRVSRYLEGEGLDVIWWLGPSDARWLQESAKPPRGPDTDVVVLDLARPDDDLLEGVSSMDLLTYFVSRGEPVVAIARGGHDAHPYHDPEVLCVGASFDRADLLEAIGRSLLTRDRSRGHVNRRRDPRIARTINSTAMPGHDHRARHRA